MNGATVTADGGWATARDAPPPSVASAGELERGDRVATMSGRRSRPRTSPSTTTSRARPRGSRRVGRWERPSPSRSPGRPSAGHRYRLVAGHARTGARPCRYSGGGRSTARGGHARARVGGAGGAVYCPFRALLHLRTWADRRRTFERVAASLRPGGRFAWNAFAFDHHVAAGLDGQHQDEPQPHTIRYAVGDNRVDISTGRRRHELVVVGDQERVARAHRRRRVRPRGALRWLQQRAVRRGQSRVRLRRSPSVSGRPRHAGVASSSFGSRRARSARSTSSRCSARCEARTA